MLIQQRTQSLSEVVNDLLVSTRSLNDDLSSVISKQGEELLEAAAQQMEAIKILEKGAGSLKLQYKSLMLQLQASIGTIEAMQHDHDEMRRNLSDMKEELQVYEDDGMKPRKISALQKFGEKRSVTLKQQQSNDDLDPLQVLFNRSLEEIEMLKEVSAKVEAEREAERQLTEERAAELEKSVTVNEDQRIHMDVLLKQLEAASIANAILESRIECERGERAQAVRSRDDEILRLRETIAGLEMRFEKCAARNEWILVELQELTAKLATERAKKRAVPEAVQSRGDALSRSLARSHSLSLADEISRPHEQQIEQEEQTQQLLLSKEEPIPALLLSKEEQVWGTGGKGHALCALVECFVLQVLGMHKRAPGKLHSKEDVEKLMREVRDGDKAHMVVDTLLTNVSAFLFQMRLAEIVEIAKQKALKGAKGANASAGGSAAREEQEDDDTDNLLKMQEEHKTIISAAFVEKMFQKEQERQNRLALLRHEHYEFGQQKFIEVHAPLVEGSCIKIEHNTASELFTTIPVPPCTHQAARSLSNISSVASPRSARYLPKVSQSSDLTGDGGKQAWDLPKTTRSRESADYTESPTSTSLRSASLLPKVSQSSNLAMDKGKQAANLPKLSKNSALAMDLREAGGSIRRTSESNGRETVSFGKVVEVGDARFLLRDQRSGNGTQFSTGLFHTIDRKYSVQEVEMLITKALAEERKRGSGGGERNGRWKLDTCTWHPPPALEPLYIYRARTRRLGTHGHSKFLSTC
jgi:hypothetical protein